MSNRTYTVFTVIILTWAWIEYRKEDNEAKAVRHQELLDAIKQINKCS